MSKVLIVDDDAAIRKSIADVLEYDHYKIELAEDGVKGLEAVEVFEPDVILLDLKMPGIDGQEVLQELKSRGSTVPVIVLTGHGDLQTGHEVTKLGAYDVMDKPPDFDVLRNRVRNAMESIELRRENQNLREQVAGPEILGASAGMEAVQRLIDQVAPTDARVLITGESGTGKELIAQAIHLGAAASRAGALVKVNCAAIPAELIESELFGHEKGSFTGAHARKTGKFEAADGGTLFLDEVGDMPLAAQAKVLRVLQEGEVERVGGNDTIHVDVRVVAATNKDLPEKIEEGEFREDLYYRLNVVPIHLPPLRERADDVKILAARFLEDVCARNGLGTKRFDESAVNRIQHHGWPGNVRELRNYVERTAILCAGDEITAADLPPLDARSGSGLEDLVSTVATLQEFKDVSEKAFLEAKLQDHNWNIARTAKAIDVQRSNIYKKLERHGLENPSRSTS